MPYITLDDLQKRDSERDLINVTDPTGAAIDEDVVDQAISNAQAVVDSYIAGRLRLPLADDEVSQSLKNATQVIARWYLYADRKTEAVQAEYDQTLSWLKDVAKGEYQELMKEHVRLGGKASDKLPPSDRYFLEDRVRAAYRGNYDRLAQLKGRYDPENTFHVNQNIRPAD